jgi:hypothetical protein
MAPCYTTGVLARIDAYLDGLQREFAVPLIDGRTWVPDDQFFEEMHVTHAGARTCALRFESEALPLLLLQLKRGAP